MRSLSFVIALCVTAAAFAGEPQRLTENGRLKFSPFFRQEGREIVYVELSDPTIYRLQRLNLKDGTVQPLHTEANTAEFEPFWAADGEAYAYLKTRGALSVSLMLRDGQGNILNEILPEDGFCGYRHPTVSRSKSLVAFSYAEKGMQQIYSSKFNGSERRMLTDSPGLNHWPAFSPDGESIAFGSSREGNFEIYVMHADGSNVRRLTDHPLQDMRPRFSPDGKRIAFTSHRDGNAEIYMMHADGSNLARITNHPERDDYAEWHPDGARLVVVSERNGRHDLYLVDVPK